jgi:hypothetical protein
MGKYMKPAGSMLASAVLGVLLDRIFPKEFSISVILFIFLFFVIWAIVNVIQIQFEEFSSNTVSLKDSDGNEFAEIRSYNGEQVLSLDNSHRNKFGRVASHRRKNQ